VAASRPFVGGAGKLLDRLLYRTRDPETNQPLVRDDFLITNIIRCRPPDNKLTGEDWEYEAIEHCRPALEILIKEFQPRAIVALGNQPFRWFTGNWGIDKLRGYIFDSRFGPVIGTYHPAYIMRGQFHLARVFELDIKKALYVSRHGKPFLKKTYITHPSPDDARVYAARYFNQGCPPIAFDIETPYAKIEKDDDITVEASIEDDLSYKHLLRISFAFEDGVAISMPWQPPYISIAQAILASKGDKIVWNRHFDVPRLVANGAPVLGRIYDGMDAWHFAEPSIPMGLKYAATFHCPDMPPWKLMSHEQPEWYNAADSDVARRVMLAVRRNLEAENRWTTFERHFVDLGLVLQEISAHGIKVDQAKRKFERERFQAWYANVLAEIQTLVPTQLIPRQVFKVSEERLKKPNKKGTISWEDGRMSLVKEALTEKELLAERKKQERLALALSKKKEREAKKLAAAAAKKPPKQSSRSRRTTKASNSSQDSKSTAESVGG
jgi:uracil-DNA glycosylase family 4